MKHYDVIVVGLGGMGCATVWSASRRGLKVLGLEQWHRRHSWGSSHGETRILRRSLSDPKVYGGLLDLAYRNWSLLEEQCGRRLFHRVGTVVVGKRDGWLLNTSLGQAKEWGIDAVELAEPPPGFRLAPGEGALRESDAGFLLSDACMDCMLDHSRADLHYEEPVSTWSEVAGGVEVRTPRGRYHAAALVVTAGPWLPAFFPELASQLGVERQLVVWLESPKEAFPTFDWEVGERTFLYGIPGLPVATRGFKVGLERPGHEVLPEHLDRSVSSREVRELRQHLVDRIPALAESRVVGATACLYTRHPDELFVLGRHPAHPSVVVAGAFQGLGFKFAAGVGEVLADLAVEGKTSITLDPFAPSRLLGRPQ